MRHRNGGGFAGLADDDDDGNVRACFLDLVHNYLFAATLEINPRLPLKSLALREQHKHSTATAHLTRLQCGRVGVASYSTMASTLRLSAAYKLARPLVASSTMQRIRAAGLQPAARRIGAASPLHRLPAYTAVPLGLANRGFGATLRREWRQYAASQLEEVQQPVGPDAAAAALPTEGASLVTTLAPSAANLSLPAPSFLCTLAGPSRNRSRNVCCWSVSLT